MLYRLLAAPLLCGGALSDDVFVVPDLSLPRILQVTHHGDVTLCHSDAGDAQQIYTALEGAGVEVDMWTQDVRLSW